MSPRLHICLAAFSILAGATLARAEPSQPLPAQLSARQGRLVVDLDLASAYSPDLQKQLSNGLTNVIALHVGLVPERGREPVALYGREIDVLFDVWEESYGVVIRDPSSPRGRTRSFRSFPELRAFLNDLREVDLGPTAGLGSGTWVVETRLELNPVSKELLERTREFMANPASTGRGGSPSRSVLGTMASYLLERTGPGQQSLVHRTRSFTSRDVTVR